tara:strand:+ start:676 stop:1413 length:738 start_codon:yes stop_codon:yes gene_type:complete
MVHLKLKPYKCSKCPYKFSKNNDLQLHIKRIHDKIKDHHCKLCNYKCSKNGTLQAHIKIVHIKIKDHHCKLCDHKFSTSSNLQQHIKIVHTKIKNHHCTKCDYKSSQSNNLQTHIKTCTGKDTCSSGEHKIKQILNEMRVKYEFDSSYEVRSDKGLLRWDFIIDSTEPIFIEFDGKQHFTPVSFGGISAEKAKLAFDRQKKYDKLKNDYCSDNGYLLLRIAYTEYENTESIVVKFIRDNTDWGFE